MESFWRQMGGTWGECVDDGEDVHAGRVSVACRG